VEMVWGPKADHKKDWVGTSSSSVSSKWTNYVYKASRTKGPYFTIFFVGEEVLEFELRASCLLGRDCITFCF
jgi:hypothetical protein